ncbi:MAG: peptidylprolyl isomerase [Acidobacteria bacterium]|jgi:FKBP-type peptidyl-prolyl cis-trans isomerase|nr:peptidylprolyl isomerase [Acidobacteriota bacterium]
MKKTIVSLCLLLTVFAGYSFSQTKRRTNLRRAKPPVVKRVIKRKIAAPVKKSASVTTPSGLTYVVTQAGTGAQLKAGDTVIVHYTGLLTNGVKFDSSLDRNTPFSFPLGAGRVIKGWDEGLQKLRIGDRATFFIPPDLGYGARGAGGVIPPNATLIFIVEVVGVE